MNYELMFITKLKKKEIHGTPAVKTQSTNNQIIFTSEHSILFFCCFSFNESTDKCMHFLFHSKDSVVLVLWNFTKQTKQQHEQMETMQKKE